MGAETILSLYRRLFVPSYPVKFIDSLLGTETSFYLLHFSSPLLKVVKFISPLLGTETKNRSVRRSHYSLSC